MQATGTDGNAELALDGALMRWRSRKLERDSSYALKVLREFATDQVGDGIRPQFETGTDKGDRRLTDDFEEFVYQCDSLTGGTLYGNQHQLAMALARDGGAMLRRRWRRPGDADLWGRPLTVPLQIQTLELDYLTTSLDGQSQNGTIANGIEINPYGQRVAYHLYRSHPGSQWMFGGNGSAFGLDVPSDTIMGGFRGDVSRVSASEILHVFPYSLTRPGQITAAPWLHAVILRLWDLDGWMDATMLARRMSASMGAFVTGGDPLASPDSVDSAHPVNDRDSWKVLDGAGYPLELTEPGVIGYCPNGKTVEFPEQPSVPGHEESSRVSLREIAAGTGMSYEALSGDVSQGNFISLRVALLGRRRLMDSLRSQVTIPMLCRPLGYWFLAAEDLSGRYRQTRDPVRVRWIPPAHEDADELTRIKILAAKIRYGFASWEGTIRGEQCDPEQLAAEIRRSNLLLDGSRDGGAPIILDSDPRRMTQAGQPAAPAEPSPINGTQMPDNNRDKGGVA